MIILNLSVLTVLLALSSRDLKSCAGPAESKSHENRRNEMTLPRAKRT